MAFARTPAGLEYALVQDATGKTAGEIHTMGEADRYMTAMLRARYYREKHDTSNSGRQSNAR